MTTDSRSPNQQPDPEEQDFFAELAGVDRETELPEAANDGMSDKADAEDADGFSPLSGFTDGLPAGDFDFSADEDSAAGDDGESFAEMLGENGQENDFILDEPEPMVHTFVDGHRVEFRRTLVRGLLALAALTALVFIVLILLDGIPARSPSTAGTALEREMLRDRQVILAVRDLGEFAPLLESGRLVAGLDLDLFDAGRRVAPDRYRIEPLWQRPRVTLLLDFARSPATNPALAARIRAVVEQIENTAITRDSRRLAPLVSVWQWQGEQPVKTRHFEESVPADLASSRLSCAPKLQRGGMLFNALCSLTNSPAESHLVIHLSDHPAEESAAFNSVEIYNLLKKNPRFAVYHRRLDQPAGDEHRDPFVYLQKNSADFGVPNWAFVREGETRETGTSTALNGLLTRSAFVSGCNIVYRPDAENLADIEARADGRRPLEVKLRRMSRDGDLATVPRQLVAPSAYRLVLPPATDIGRRVLYATNGTSGHVDGEFIFAVDDQERSMQYTAGLFAATRRAELVAALPGGIFLARAATNAVLAVDALPDGIVFAAPHFVFEREFEAATGRGTNPSAALALPETTRPTELANTLFVYTAQNDDDAFDDAGKVGILPLGKAAPDGDERLGKNRSALATALVKPSRTVYRDLRQFASTSLSNTSRGGQRCHTSGFELLAALDTLQRCSVNGRAVAVFDTAAVIPALWNEAGARDIRHLEKMLDRIAARGIALVVPAPAKLPDVSCTVAASNVFVVAAADCRDGIRVTLPRTRPDAPARLLLAPATVNGHATGGGAIAAAWCAPLFLRAAAVLTNADLGEIAEAVARSAELRGETGIPKSFYNPGIASPRLLPVILSNRLLQRQSVLRFRTLDRNPYRTAESIFCDGFGRELGSGTRLSALPEQTAKGYSRAYQYFDRAALWLGNASRAPRYDANEPFRPNATEAAELALVGWRGSLFVLCSRNGNRGWILNLESVLPQSAAIQYDPGDGLVVVPTGHGELLFVDQASGLILPVTLVEGDLERRQAALITDHGTGQMRLLLDAERNVLWHCGSGSRWLTRIEYRRERDSVICRYDATRPVHAQPLARAPFFPGMDMQTVFSQPVLFRTGSVNLITAGTPAGYLRFDTAGQTIRNSAPE